MDKKYKTIVASSYIDLIEVEDILNVNIIPDYKNKKILFYLKEL